MTTPIAAADVFPSSAPSREPDRDAVLQPIRDMLDGCGSSNRNDLLVIAYEALIEAGVDAGPELVRSAVALGFKREHAGAVLGRSEGPSTARHRWHRGADGRYRLHRS